MHLTMMMMMMTVTGSLYESTEILKWFCTNRTMVNLDDVVRCDACLFILFLDTINNSSTPFLICGEHKESGTLRHGFYASPCSPELDFIQVESEARGGDKCNHIMLGLFNNIFICCRLFSSGQKIFAQRLQLKLFYRSWF